MDEVQYYLEKAHFHLFDGNLRFGGSWGGEECSKYLSQQVLLGESLFWVVLIIWLGNSISMRETLRELIRKATEKMEKHYDHRSILQWLLDRIVASFMLTIFLMLIYYKYNTNSLCQLIQPCHLILLTQAICLSSDGSNAIIFGLLQLPLYSHVLALGFPDTTGLDQPLEKDMYWYQHYLTAFFPIYILMRHNFAALDLLTQKIWWSFHACITLAHFVGYAGLDYLFKVNVQFMLCPADGMLGLISISPSWVLTPSYRTSLFIATTLLSIALTVAAVTIAKAMRSVISPGQVEAESKKIKAKKTK
jgi:hypothetical protein